MIAKICNLKDLEAELERYFKVMREMPGPKFPGMAKNFLYFMAKYELNAEDKDFIRNRFEPTNEDIADMLQIDTYWFKGVSRQDYCLLRRMLLGHPRKVIAFDLHINRTALYRRYDRILNQIFQTVRA